MVVRVNKRCGCPRTQRKNILESEIPVGEVVGRVHHKVFQHSCGCRIKINGYGYTDVIKCPQCGVLIPYKLPRCSRCGVFCSDLDTKTIHERYCTGEHPSPVHDNTPLVGHTAPGYHLSTCTKCGKRFKENGKDICKECSHGKRTLPFNEQTSDSMKKRWQDPVFRERTIAGMKASYARYKQKADGKEQLDSAGASA